MKRICKMYIGGCLMLALAAGAVFAESWDDDGDGGYRISSVEDFNGVVNSTRADVIVNIGTKHSIRAEGDRRVLRRYRIDVRDERLRIRNPWRPWNLFSLFRDQKIVFEITTTELDYVKVSGSGGASVVDPLRGDAIELRTSGSGDISAAGTADEIQITITGSGDVSFDGSCREAELTLSSSGTLQTALEAGEVAAKISGSGDIDIRGSAEELDIRVSSSGRFSGSEFSANIADITISGSGDVLTSVKRNLEARLTGSGDLRLSSGSPEIESRTSGSGRIIQEE